MNETERRAHDDHAHEPLLEGARLTRRTALRGTLAVPALMALSAVLAPGRAATPRATGADDAPGRDDEIAAFLDAWQKRTADAVAAGSTDDDGHLHALLADLARLDIAAFPPRRVDAYSDDQFTSGPILGTPEFLVLEFELVPDAAIQAHNHVGFSFVSVGVDGECTVRHYEPDSADHPDPGGELDVPFDLREVQRTVLTRGRTSSLTRTRANIHQFQAGPAGSRFIDFGVNYKTPAGGYESFSKLEIEPAPKHAARGIHSARWIGNPKS